VTIRISDFVPQTSFISIAKERGDQFDYDFEEVYPKGRRVDLWKRAGIGTDI
jgi:hypothetical protein